MGRQWAVRARHPTAWAGPGRRTDSPDWPSLRASARLPRMTLSPPGYESSPLSGTDLSWIAVDRDGHVGWLVTMGSAVVPPWISVTPEALDDLEAALKALPARGGCVARSDSSTEAEWSTIARRGFFTFDWGVLGPVRSNCHAPHAGAHGGTAADARVTRRPLVLRAFLLRGARHDRRGGCAAARLSAMRPVGCGGHSRRHLGAGDLVDREAR